MSESRRSHIYTAAAACLDVAEAVPATDSEFLAGRLNTSRRKEAWMARTSSYHDSHGLFLQTVDYSHGCPLAGRRRRRPEFGLKALKPALHEAPALCSLCHSSRS